MWQINTHSVYATLGGKTYKMKTHLYALHLSCLHWVNQPTKKKMLSTHSPRQLYQRQKNVRSIHLIWFYFNALILFHSHLLIKLIWDGQTHAHIQSRSFIYFFFKSILFYEYAYKWVIKCKVKMRKSKFRSMNLHRYHCLPSQTATASMNYNLDTYCVLKLIANNENSRLLAK